MPLPTPHKRESRGDFVSRCIGFLSDKGEMKDHQQRIAVCYTQWKTARASADAVIGNGDQETLSTLSDTTKEQFKAKANGEGCVEEVREEYISQGREVIKELLNAANKVAAFLEDESYNGKTSKAWVFEKIVLSKAMICGAAHYIEFGEDEDSNEEATEKEGTSNIGLIEPESAKVISKDYIREKIYNNKFGAPTY